MALWSNSRNIFKYAFTKNPLQKRSAGKNLSKAGIASSDVANLRGTNINGYDSNVAGLKETHDSLDLNFIENRPARYKEYEKLRVVPEIEQVMTILADEACIGEDTLIETPYYGSKSIKWFADNKKNEDFAVYCWDFKKKDYTIGWAFNPRKTGTRETVKISFDNGENLIATPDHRVLLKTGEWIEAGELKFGDELMPFYRLKVNSSLNSCKNKLYPRIFTFNKGWINERQFIDEWRLGKSISKYERFNKITRAIVNNPKVAVKDLCSAFKTYDIKDKLENHGFTRKELQWLSKKSDVRRVVYTQKWAIVDVYDLSVREHENFCTSTAICHNCQVNDNGNVFEIECKNKEVREELQFIMQHKSMLNLNQRFCWNAFKKLIIKGDQFWEMCISVESPKDGILGIQALPPETMVRLETIRGDLLGFQQSSDCKPDKELLNQILKGMDADNRELRQSSIIAHFTPDQVIHLKIGDDRDDFFPYGVSVIEPARPTAHMCRLLVDSMLVYRITRNPERRVFYVDIGNLPSSKAEALMSRMKDQFRKKKVPGRNPTSGVSGVEERWSIPAMDEDFWVPIRQGSGTRIETLPGACLALNTKIPLLDGRVLTLQEIIEEFNQGKELWAYSCNPKNGEFAPGKISWAGVTRQNTSVVKLTFDNGESITCTPDHKFPIIGKGNIQAKDLKIGESMIPFNTRLKKLNDLEKTKTYRQIYNPATRGWKFVHRIVAEYFKGTTYENSWEFNKKLAKNGGKMLVHHVDFNRYNNAPENLNWMTFTDHAALHSDTIKLLHQYNAEHREEVSAKIGKSVAAFYKNLTPEEKEKYDVIYRENIKKAYAVFSDKLQNNQEFNASFREKQKEGWEKFKGTKEYKARSKKITTANKERWKDPEYKKNIFDKQTVVYPKPLMDKFMVLIAQHKYIEDITDAINNDPETLQIFLDANKHVIRDNFGNKFKLVNARKMVHFYGYKNIQHARREAKQYNHKLISIEFLNEKMDTGTLTIDQNEEFHDFHNFAIALGNDVTPGEYGISGVYTLNSNTSEIDDIRYIQRLLFIALNFPPNYFNQEDVGQTRITLSYQNSNVARYIERLQSSLVEGLWEVAYRHLILRGYPEEMFDDLKIVITPPSAWKELTEAEVKTNRINNATTLKSSGIFSDYDIFIDCMKLPPEEAKIKLARLKIQKLEDLKLQILAQNPTLTGIGLPGANEKELGTEPGGSSPDLNPPDNGQSPGEPSSNEGDAGNQQPPGGGRKTMQLPNAEPDEIKKYDLGLPDYANEMDSEEIDWSVN